MMCDSKYGTQQIIKICDIIRSMIANMRVYRMCAISMHICSMEDTWILVYVIHHLYFMYLKNDTSYLYIMYTYHIYISLLYLTLYTHIILLKTTHIPYIANIMCIYLYII